MLKYRCQTDQLPQNLYRVQFHGCQTTLSGTGLEARDTSLVFSDHDTAVSPITHQPADMGLSWNSAIHHLLLRQRARAELGAEGTMESLTLE